MLRIKPPQRKYCIQCKTHLHWVQYLFIPTTFFLGVENLSSGR